MKESMSEPIRRIFIFNPNNIALLGHINLREVSYPDDADLIVVYGGDGTMLKAIAEYAHLDIPFYGINRGHVGYLLNKEEDPLWQKPEESKVLELFPLYIEAEGDSDAPMKALAFNDVWISPQAGQTVHMKMSINGRKIMGAIQGDGLIFSTPQGSTGYNRAAGGMIVKPSLPIIQITPKACTIGARRAIMNPILEKDDAVIFVEFLDTEYRVPEIYSDGRKWELNNPTNLTVRKSDRRVRLVFSEHTTFYNKIYDLEYHGYGI